MTSFIIKAHVGREVAKEWNQDDSCAFCRVIRRETPASVLYETDKVIAILDILPLREGHTLVIPKHHCPRVSDLPAEYAGATGEAISKVALALTKALDHPGLNVVCNQEYAQVVPHVHYHVIPAPKLNETVSPQSSVASEVSLKWSEGLQRMHKMEFESRDTLDEGEAQEFVSRVKAHL